MRIAIVIGHNSRSQGAVRVTDRASEYVWNGDLATRIKELAPSSVRIFRRTPGANEISRVYGDVAAWGADCAVELHFNAFSSPSAHGCETLHGTNAASKALGELVQERMLFALGNADRGLLRRANGRGSTTVNQSAQPTVLIEPYFGSNPAECRLADDRKDALAEAILNGARAFLGQDPVSAPKFIDIVNDDVRRLRDIREEIGDLSASALAGWSPDLPIEVQRERWLLKTIFDIAAQET